MLKNLLLIMICAFTMSIVSAQMEVVPLDQNKIQTPSDGGPVMEFDSKTVDYGTMKQHGEPLRVVSFTNTGDEPLVIKNCKGSCGCTVPTWPKEPIMPGESGEIEIRYATNRLGKINKTVRITTNEGTDPHVLKVVGEINKAEEEESVPKSEPSMLSGGSGGK